MLLRRKEPSEAAMVDCLYPEIALWIVTTAFSIAAPEGSTTVPSMVPALMDWAYPAVEMIVKSTLPAIAGQKASFIESSSKFLLKNVWPDSRRETDRRINL